MRPSTERDNRAPRTLSARLFFAAWPDNACAQQLHDWASRLNREGRARPVPAERFHLTLAFLGALPLEGLPRVLAIGEQTAAAGLPSCLSLDQVECWPGPRVAVATATTTPASLAQLAEALRKALAASGIACEARPFRAHITLLRHIRTLSAEPPTGWLDLQIDTLSLVGSASDHDGRLSYRKLAEWPLRGVQKTE